MVAPGLGDLGVQLVLGRVAPSLETDHVHQGDHRGHHDRDRCAGLERNGQGCPAQQPTVADSSAHDGPSA
jgi:hypothetical protein